MPDDKALFLLAALVVTGAFLSAISASAQQAAAS